jgi:hypothetical protein
MKDWNMLKLMSFSEILIKVKAEPGEKIYELGDLVDNVYFIAKGTVNLEIFY